MTETSPVVPPPPPLPPPPLPPPLPPLQSSSSSCPSSSSTRLRSVFWDRIPQERVEGRHSIWATSDEFPIDLSSLDELFGRLQGHQVNVPGVRSHKDKQTTTPRRKTLDRISLLERNRRLKVGIFLHHFKSTLDEIIIDIREGRGQRYGSEKLCELYKLLPDSEEEERLKEFRGERSQLEETDFFILRLVEIPNFRLRLEAMILQEEFVPTVTSVSASARCLATAAAELMVCGELHSILRLVLKTGNYMNAGGFGGNAGGFRISYLLKLADTKANRPGMNLLHFVAMEAVKQNPSVFSYNLKLRHVAPAARLSVEVVQEEFTELQCRVAALLEGLRNAPELHTHIQPFLQDAELKLSELKVEVKCVCDAQGSLMKFLCEEDDGSFKLEEACGIFHKFHQRFLHAAQENVLREQEDLRHMEREQLEREKRAGKRHSIASCSALEAGLEFDSDALKKILEVPMATPLRRNLWSTLGRRTHQRPPLISLTEAPAEKHEESPVNGDAELIQSQAESKLATVSSQSLKAGSVKSSTHSTCIQSKKQTPSARLHPKVGETHALVSALQSYSCLAPPIREAQQEKTEESEHEVTERTKGMAQEVRAMTSSQVDGNKRGNLREWTRNDLKTTSRPQQTREHTITPPLRASCKPLPRIGSRYAPPLSTDQSERVSGDSEKEGPIRGEQKATLTLPLHQLLHRTSSIRNKKEKSQKKKKKKKEKDGKEKQRTERDRAREEGERERETGE